MQTDVNGVFQDENTELLERCRDGDILLFRELYVRHKTPLYSLAFRFHGNHADAEDSLQEAFIRIYRSLKSFRREASVQSWMYRIVINTCISSTRSMAAKERKTDFTDEFEQPVSTSDPGDAVLRDMLENEISRLPELQRAVFLLYASDGFTHPEISDMLDIRIGTSKSYYHRAKGTLRKGLAARGIKRFEVIS